MKINLLLVTISLSTLLACNANNGNSKTQKIKKMQETSSNEMVKTQTIKLSKGELFIALVGFRMANKETLLQEYFGVVFPPAQKHGFTPLGQLPIDQIATGDFMANEFVGLFKWPSMESVQAFMGEVSPEKLAKLRAKIWSELKQHIIMVPDDIEMNFKENKVYEVKMVWTDKMIDVSKISKNGGTIIFNNPVAGYEDLGKNEAPTNLLIIEWNDKTAAEAFKAMKLLSFNKEEAYYTHFDFPQEK